jgi:hypothetical protein
LLVVLVVREGGNGGLAAGGRDVLPTAHVVVEDGDHNLMVAFKVEDEEVAVTARKNPQIRIACFFSIRVIMTSCIIIHL